MAKTLKNTSVAQIEAWLDRQRNHERQSQRTSVATHMAWIPDEWSLAAEHVMRALGDRVPSRTLLLHPEPGSEVDGFDASVVVERFSGDKTGVSAEIVRIRLHGSTAEAPASVVVPLQLPDLPVFLRWRGRPDLGSPAFEQLAGVVDRLVVDSAEWPDVPTAYSELAGVFDQVAVSDIAWRRTLPWRRALAQAWPDLPDRLTGPPAETALVAGWLSSRAGIAVEIERADELPVGDQHRPSDLLSAELDSYGRDAVYEEAVRTAGRL
jgi:glucose-6-phosphate dehydrogenase-like protein OpcA